MISGHSLMMKYVIRPFLYSLIAFTICACQTPGAAAKITSTAIPSTITPIPPTPTFTPVPLAAIVNGEQITLAQYQAEQVRFRAASGTNLATEDEQILLGNLIDQALLVQAAREEGFTVTESDVQAHIDKLVTELGSTQALTGWMERYSYTEEDFRQDLARSIAAAWMRDQIIAQVPATAEQVHVRQILLYNSDRANEVYAQVKAGSDFAVLAGQYDPVTKGDLGWFPRGFLLDPTLEEAAFNLQPGDISEVIQTKAGFHILQLLERDPQRLIDPNALLVLQPNAVKDWLETHRGQSQIQILLPQS